MTAPRTRRRLWRAVLWVSLAGNLLVAGLVAGAAFQRGGESDAHRGTPGPLAPLVMALPDRDRRAVVEAFRQARGGGGRDERRQRVAALLDALAAEPFDPQAVRAELAWQRRGTEDRLRRAEALLVQRLSRMTPEERRAYADALGGRIRGR